MIAPVDITGIGIETERLILLLWQESDLENIGVGQMAGWVPHGFIETSKEILTKFIEG